MKSNTFTTVLLSVFVAGILMSFSPSSSVSKKTTTIKNLKDAYTGETTASAKYSAFAQKAREEGHNRIGLLFEAASKAESIHAGNHKSVLIQLGEKAPDVNPDFEVKDTKANLENAISGESYEIATMYPEFIKDASGENVTLAMISFNYAYQVEKKHKALYEKALLSLNEGKEKSLSDLYMICSTCGNTYDGEAPARCGISMTPKERFLRIEL